MAKDEPIKIFEPRIGWYYKVDVLEDAPAFTGTPKDVILMYLHMIKIYKRNLGKLTVYNTRIDINAVNNMTIRVSELTKAYQQGSKQKQIDKLNKIAQKHWDNFHAQMQQA